MNGSGQVLSAGGEVAAIAEELAQAAQLAMSPCASQSVRAQAYDVCER